MLFLAENGWKLGGKGALGAIGVLLGRLGRFGALGVLLGRLGALGALGTLGRLGALGGFFGGGCPKTYWDIKQIALVNFYLFYYSCLILYIIETQLFCLYL